MGEVLWLGLVACGAMVKAVLYACNALNTVTVGQGLVFLGGGSLGWMAQDNTQQDSRSAAIECYLVLAVQSCCMTSSQHLQVFACQLSAAVTSLSSSNTDSVCVSIVSH